MDELYLARARYEETLKNDPEFDENLDFVLFRDHGKAIARPYYYFKKLMKKCIIDCTKHVWHDLRHTYATLLDQNNMYMKVVSEILGHYSEEFTNEVYVIHKPEVIIYDTSEVMNSFIESLKLVRFTIERPNVISSAYSISSPIETPRAMTDIFTI